MKLQQLRYVLEVYNQGLSVSAAAEALFTSQPGVSKQIRLLEEELGVQIFVRQGKRISAVTEPGFKVLDMAKNILRQTQNIKKISDDFSHQNDGLLTIATSQAQAKYKLPGIIQAFTKKYPHVELAIKLGTPQMVCDLVRNDEADIGIETENISKSPDLCHLPSRQWQRSLMVLKDHELNHLDRPLRLEDISRYPLVTYDFAFQEGSLIAKAFQKANIEFPHVVLSSEDADVIKTYVKLGLGVGLAASMFFSEQEDTDLCPIDLTHLFEASTTHIVLKRDHYLRNYMYDFVELYEPKLGKEQVEKLLYHEETEDYSI